MVVAFKKNNSKKCALCGSANELTGEHKIKASVLKWEFGGRHTVLTGKESPKIAQSSKSKTFHFSSKICKQCNSKNTQPADKAFDELHNYLRDLHKEGCNLTDLYNRPFRPASNVSELNQFRYFAKIICCYMAEVEAPRPAAVASFAIGLRNQNPIFLRISHDERYEEKRIAFETEGFAEHGGLIFRFDDKKRWVTAIESSLSISGVKYEFWVQLSWLASLELRLFYPAIMLTSLANIVSD